LRAYRKRPRCTFPIIRKRFGAEAGKPKQRKLDTPIRPENLTEANRFLDGDELTTVEMVAKKSRPRKRKPKGSGKGGSRKRRRGGNQGDGGDESSGSDEPGSQPSGGGEEPVPVDVGPPAADLPPGRRLPGPRRPEEPEEAELDLSEVASPVPRAPPSSRRPPLPLPTGVLTRDSVLMLRPPGSGLSLSTRPLGWTVKLESPNVHKIIAKFYLF